MKKAIPAIPGGDRELHAALADVNLPTLLMVLALFDGGERWLNERFSPDPIVVPEGGLFPDDTGNYSEAIAREIRDGAFALLKEFRDNGYELPPAPSLALMRKLMEFSTAEPLDDEFCAMLLEETQFVDRDQQWLQPLKKVTGARPVNNFEVLIVGAGMSGICTAAKLKSAGIPFTICLLYTSPSPRDQRGSRMPSSA